MTERVEVRPPTIDLAPLARRDIIQWFHAGNKTLRLSFFRNPIGRIEADTYVRTIPGESSIPGATTALYRLAADLMQAACQYAPNGTVNYKFSTSNKNMKDWARDPTKGADIFHWEEIREDDAQLETGTTVLTATKSFTL